MWNPLELEFPDLLVQGVTQLAEKHAALTGACLKAIGLTARESSRLPAAFLLELAAVVQLYLWEQQDLRRYLDAEMPSYETSAKSLAARCRNGPSEFEGAHAARLSLRVLRVWTECFAWEGPHHLHADIVLGEVDEDSFLDALAGFVWAHRCELVELIRREAQE